MLLSNRRLVGQCSVAASPTFRTITLSEVLPEPVDDLALDVSHQLKIEIVPTLIRLG
jgi:hypothetical protein